MPVGEGKVDVVVLVHGTGASAPEDVGTRWWQRGSGFWSDLDQHLIDLPGRLSEGTLFRWSGANSERERRRAALDLFENWLNRFETEQQPYHLIGHSHGGSVIWLALQESVRRQQPLRYLRSWATVGTPFMHYRLQRSNWLLALPLVVGLVLFFPLLDTDLVAWRHMHELTADNEATTLVALLLLSTTAAAFLLFFIARLAILLVTGQRLVALRRIESEAMSAYGAKWLGLWSEDDEAINGLRNTIGFGVSFSPRIILGSDGSTLIHRLLLLPLSLCGGLYNIFIARSIDVFICGRISRRLQGCDQTAHLLAEVSSAPGQGQPSAPLPTDIRRALTAAADAQAATTLRKVRQTFGASATESYETPLVLGSIASQFTFQELVHTSYFDVPEIRRLLTDHIASWTQVETLSALAPSKQFGDKEGHRQVAAAEHPTSKRLKPMQSAVGPLYGRLRNRIATSATFLALIFVPMGLVAISAQAINKAVLEYGEDYNVAAILRSPPLLAIEEDRLATNEAKEKALRDWFTALVVTGRVDTAVDFLAAFKRHPTGSADLPTLWVAAALARRGRSTEAKEIAAPVTSPFFYKQVVEHLINQGELETAKFMAELIDPTAYERAFVLARIAVSLAQRSEPERAMQIAAGITNGDDAGSIAMALIETKRTDLALVIARKITVPSIRIALMCQIAQAFAISGHANDAQVIADEVLSVTVEADHSRENLNPGELLGPTAISLAKAGFVKEALRALPEIKSPHLEDRQSYAMGHLERAARSVAVVFAKAGLAQEARQAAEFVTDKESARAFTLGDVAKVLAEQRRAADAWEFVGAINGDYFRESALNDVALALAKAGSIDDAITSALRIGDRPQAIGCLVNLGRLLAPSSNAKALNQAIDHALEKLKGVDQITLLQKLPDLVGLLVKSSRLEEASKISAAVVDAARSYALQENRSYEETMGHAVGSLVEAGFLEEGLSVANLIQDSEIRNDAYKNVASAFARAGESSRAQAIAAKVTDDTAGQQFDPTGPAQSTFAERIWSVKALPASSERDEGLKSITSDVNTSEQLNMLLDAIKDENGRDVILRRVIESYAEGGTSFVSSGQVMTMVLQISDVEARQIAILQLIGKRQLDRTQVRAGLDLISREAGSVTDVVNRLAIYGRAADEYVKLGELRRARLLAELSGPTDRVSTYAAILTAYSQQR